MSVVIAGWETPGPFPNPEAKPPSADGTAPGRVWESRTLPAIFSWGWGGTTVMVVLPHPLFLCAHAGVCGVRAGVVVL